MSEEIEWESMVGGPGLIARHGGLTLLVWGRQHRGEMLWRPEVVRGVDILERHWGPEFDSAASAQVCAVKMSERHLTPKAPTAEEDLALLAPYVLRAQPQCERELDKPDDDGEYMCPNRAEFELEGPHDLKWNLCKEHAVKPEPYPHRFHLRELPIMPAVRIARRVLGKDGGK